MTFWVALGRSAVTAFGLLLSVSALAGAVALSEWLADLLPRRLSWLGYFPVLVFVILIGALIIWAKGIGAYTCG